jgi:hypothetical protein
MHRDSAAGGTVVDPNRGKDSVIAELAERQHGVVSPARRAPVELSSGEAGQAACDLGSPVLVTLEHGLPVSGTMEAKLNTGA